MRRFRIRIIFQNMPNYVTIPVSNGIISVIWKEMLGGLCGLASLLCAEDNICKDVCGRVSYLWSCGAFSDAQNQENPDDRCAEKHRISIE